MASGGPRPCLGCSPSLALALRVADPSHSAALETMSHCHTVTGQSAIRVRLRVGWREISLHRRRAPRAGMARPSARPSAARACLRLRFPTSPPSLHRHSPLPIRHQSASQFLARWPRAHPRPAARRHWVVPAGRRLSRPQERLAGPRRRGARARPGGCSESAHWQGPGARAHCPDQAVTRP